MIPLHCTKHPQASLPRNPDEYLADWKHRSGLRTALTTDAMNFLERLGKDRVMVCEQANDASLMGLKWSIYQDRNRPELFVVIGKLGTNEFGSVQYLPERTAILEREGFTYQRLSQFQAITEKMKETFLGAIN